MTAAAELREARENAYWPDFVPGNAALSRAILDAIDIALPILEADPALVDKQLWVDCRETISWALDMLDMADKRLVALGDPEELVYSEVHLKGKAKARRILAAISTPTPVEES